MDITVVVEVRWQAEDGAKMPLEVLQVGLDRMNPKAVPVDGLRAASPGTGVAHRGIDAGEHDEDGESKEEACDSADIQRGTTSGFLTRFPVDVDVIPQ